MAKQITVTARGNKLDFDALRKSNPNTKPIIAGKKKEPAKAVAKKLIPPARVRRIKATVPAPIPTSVHIATEAVGNYEEPIVKKQKVREKENNE